LVINSDHEALRDAAVRRRLLSAIEREPIASVACGEPACAAAHWAPASSDPRVALPESLELLLYADDASFELVARVLQHQLRRLGVRLRTHAVGLDALVGRLRRRDYQALLAPIPLDRSLALGRVRMYYSDPIFVAALERGDEAAATARLRDQAVVLPLYESRQFAAIDRRFCGGKPTSTGSWRWIADLYPCDGASK
jgi:hypothetical protein